MKRFLLFLSVVFLGLGIAVAQEPQTVTVTYADEGISNQQDMASITTTVTGVANITYAQNQGSTTPSYYDNGKNVRLYPDKTNGKGNSFTISPAEGITLTNVSFTFSSTSYNKLSFVSADNGSFSNGTWTGNTKSAITFQNLNKGNNPPQVRITSLKIIYTKEVAGPKDYEQTFADMTLEVGESKVLDLGEEHPETFVIDAEDAAIAEVVEAEGVFTITGKAVCTTKVSVMWEGEGWNGGETEFNLTVNPVLPAPELSFDKAEITEYIGSLEQDLPVLTATEGLKITYSSSNEAAATVDAQTGAVTLVAAGTTTITATSEATAEYKAGEASYILNVKAAPTGGYALLTNINDLVDGSVGVIASENVNLAMGNYDSDKNKFLGAEVVFANGMDVKTISWADNQPVKQFTFNVVDADNNKFTVYSSADESYLGAGGNNTNLTFNNTPGNNTVIVTLNNGVTKISFSNSTTRQLLYSTDKGANTFGNYANSNANNAAYNKVQIYIAQPAAEVVVPNMVVDGEENAEPVIVFHEGMTIHFNIPEGVRVYRRFVATEEPATPAPARVTGEDGNEYERHTEAYTVPGYGTLSYFAESQGVRSAVKEVRVSDTTGVEDITVGGEEGEAVYYDMTGRRVANPTAGLYIRVNGSTATKVYLR